MPKEKKTSKAESSRAKAKKAAKAAPKKAAQKQAAAPKKAAKKTAAAVAPKKAAKKTAAAIAPKKAAKKTAAAVAPKKAAKKTAKKTATEASTETIAAAPKKGSAKKAAKAASTEPAAAAPKKGSAKKVAEVASNETVAAAPKKGSTKKVAKAASTEPAAAAPKKAATKLAAAPQAGGSDHDAAIARIEAKAAAAGVTLAAGANAKAIKAAEKALGAALPEEVVAFYRRHDGADGDGAIEGRELLSLSRMVGEWKIWKDLLDQGTFEANDHGRPDPGVQQKWWIAEWVPVTYDGAGNHHVIDLAPAEGGTRGQVLSFWHDDDPRTVVAKDFLTWLEEASWGSEGDHARDLVGDDEDDDGDEDDDDDDDEPEGAAGGDERRFEMDQKFWAIRLDGDSFTVRFGKLGTDGQEQTKSFDDEDAARKEHDKLVAAKTKKGYREV